MVHQHMTIWLHYCNCLCASIPQRPYVINQIFYDQGRITLIGDIVASTYSYCHVYVHARIL